MNFKSFPSLSNVVFGLFLCALSVTIQAQTIKDDKSGSVAAFVAGKTEESGQIRKRIVESEVTKKSAFDIPTINQISEFERITFALINQKRQERGLQPLMWSEELAKIARMHSENMAKFDFFGHRGLDGKMVNDRADSLGLTKWTAMGENIAFNRGYQNPLECAVEKWMESVGHRENLLNSRWKESGIGIAVTNSGTFYFTQVFLKRK